MTKLEIERTFLAARIPEEIEGQTPSLLEDIYVTRGSGTSIIRLRKSDDHHELTKKSTVGHDHSTHNEQTISLTSEEFERLKNASQLRIEKKRYNVTIEGRAAEVDVFTGELSGLVVIDFEFSTEQERDDFTMPSCCLADVTQDKEISAGQLVGKSFADLQSWLDTYGYKSL